MFRLLIPYKDPMSGEEIVFEIFDGQFKHIPIDMIMQSCTVVLNSANQMLIAHNQNSGNVWQLPGGGREEGESVKQCAVREILEEANVIVDPKNLKHLYYQYVSIKQYDELTDKTWYEKQSAQVRFIARATTINEFKEDPDGDIDKIMWINVEDLGKYLFWGETVNLVIELVNKHLESI